MWRGQLQALLKLPGSCLCMARLQGRQQEQLRALEKLLGSCLSMRGTQKGMRKGRLQPLGG